MIPVINGPLPRCGLKLLGSDVLTGIWAQNMCGPIDASPLILQRPWRISTLSAMREVAESFFRIRSLFVTSDRWDVEKQLLEHAGPPVSGKIRLDSSFLCVVNLAKYLYSQSPA